MSNPTELSPNVDNIQVGKGIVSFMADGESEYRDLGNCTAFTITPTVETLEHFTSREGTRKKDLTIIIEQSATVSITMEEMTAQNIAMMLYGTTDLADVDGPKVEIFGTSVVKGALKFVGTNDVGPKMNVELWNVNWTPTGDLNMISDEFNKMELEGDILAASSGPNVGKYGYVQITNSTPS
jgi:hypothetical protein